MMTIFFIFQYSMSNFSEKNMLAFAIISYPQETLRRRFRVLFHWWTTKDWTTVGEKHKQNSSQKG